MDNEILVEARALSRRYGNTAAVSDLTLTLRKGEILGLLGPNGAGKSTTMKMLVGVLAPTGGSVTINGVSLSEEPKQAKRNIGYLPEQPPVYPELTVEEYLRYCAGLHGITSGERTAAVARVKKSCGLADVASRLIGNLSKGYQQRVGIAQAIIHRPAVVILDEPTVGLDPIQILEIRSLIKELGEQHSVILSSHILPEVQAVCGRVMIIDKGRVVYAEALRVAGAEEFRTVLATFRNPPAVATLTAIAGVTGLDALGRGQVRFHVADNSDSRESIAAAAVSGGWGLIELRAELRSLEQIFVELTSGELHGPGPDNFKEAA